MIFGAVGVQLDIRSVVTCGAGGETGTPGRGTVSRAIPGVAGGGEVTAGGFGGSTVVVVGGGSAAGVFGANVGGLIRTGFGCSGVGGVMTTVFGGRGGNGGGTDRLGSAFGRSRSDAGSVPGASVHGCGAASAGRQNAVGRPPRDDGICPRSVISVPSPGGFGVGEGVGGRDSRIGFHRSGGPTGAGSGVGIFAVEGGGTAIGDGTGTSMCVGAATFVAGATSGVIAFHSSTAEGDGAGRTVVGGGSGTGARTVSVTAGFDTATASGG